MRRTDLISKTHDSRHLESVYYDISKELAQSREMHWSYGIPTSTISLDFSVYAYSSCSEKGRSRVLYNRQGLCRGRNDKRACS